MATSTIQALGCISSESRDQQTLCSMGKICSVSSFYTQCFIGNRTMLICLWLFSCYQGHSQQLQQRLHGLNRQANSTWLFTKFIEPRSLSKCTCLVLKLDRIFISGVYFSLLRLLSMILHRPQCTPAFPGKSSILLKRRQERNQKLYSRRFPLLENSYRLLSLIPWQLECEGDDKIIY